MTTAAADFVRQRHEMVERQVRARGVRAPLVLAAMRGVRREEFLPESMKPQAYADSALPIEAGQTMSQPYIVALMLEALQLHGGERALEVGTGSGYAAAVMSKIADEVYSVERHEQLARLARLRLTRDGCNNVCVLCGDGTQGWPEHAPFDAISVTAGGARIPRALLDQMALGGRLVLPIGPHPDRQRLVRVTRRGPTEYRRERLAGVRFVPLIGAEGP